MRRSSRKQQVDPLTSILRPKEQKNKIVVSCAMNVVVLASQVAARNL